jgi:hypothetical protein
MHKAKPSRILLLFSLGLLLFISSSFSLRDDNRNDYDNSRNYYYSSLMPFSISAAATTTSGSAIEIDNNDESSVQDVASVIGFENVTNLSDNPNDSVYGEVAASGNNVYAVWQESVPSGSNRNYDIFMKNSIDNGTTFGSPINLSNNSGFSFNLLSTHLFKK